MLSPSHVLSARRRQEAIYSQGWARLDVRALKLAISALRTVSEEGHPRRISIHAEAEISSGRRQFALTERIVTEGSASGFLRCLHPVKLPEL